MHRLTDLLASGLLALLGAAAPASAQTTFLVGPSGLPQIRDAIALAAPGDVIVVEPGAYAHFELTIGVTIRAQQAGTVQIAFDPAFVPPGCTGSLTCLLGLGPTTLVVPPGQTAHFDGLDFVGNQFALPLQGLTAFHRVDIRGGTVVAEDCTFSTTGSSALSALDATLVLRHCSATTTGTSALIMTGLTATRSIVHAVDSSFTGSQFLFGFTPGNPGILLVGSELHGSGLTLTGQQGSPTGLGGPALVLQPSIVTGARAWLEGSTLVAGPGACAVEANGQAVELDGCTLTQASTCPSTPSAQLLGVTQPQPLQLGTTFGLDYRSEPNGFVVVFAAPALARLSLPTLFAQPLLLDTSGSFVAGLVLADATGAASAAWSIPSAPSLVDASFWFQGASGFDLPLQLSPVAGGRLR
ncbi:MAG: hypothetical protein H6835_17485 [Planctomycetes bacterium]|nr:hypothetical protein [Planctomycetota bacterium]